MLESYSWGQFFTFLSIALALYYVYVIFFYYGNDINKVIAGKKDKPASASAISPQYTHTAPPIIAESIHIDGDDIEEKETNELTDDTSDIQDEETSLTDAYDWENTKAFTMDYRDATEEEEKLLESINVAEPDSNEISEGSIPAEDYAEATLEIQKENIEEEKKETTKSVLRRAYFNASYVDLYNMNKNAKSNIDALLTELTGERKIPLGEIAVFNDYIRNSQPLII